MKSKIFEYLFEKILDHKIKSDFNLNSYIYFKNANGINKWGNEFNEFFKSKKRWDANLTKKEEYEIETYEYYAGYVSEKMNNLLRGKQTILFPELIERRIESLSKSLLNFRLKNNLIVIRRFPKSEFNHKLRKGDFYCEKGFLSTSLNLSSRLDTESNYRPINNEVLMLLKVPKGTNACYIEQISKRQEYELIIQKGKKIKIEKNLKIINNRIVIGKITS
ncbi:ADP-ribosyltransferase [Tenacibaculum ovolyticum]|uniref:ADP-ribosyltransferase n=1 Tax=Tenacibaculum ovolyticum TaxID=104270 RepID=UPI003BA979B8